MTAVSCHNTKTDVDSSFKILPVVEVQVKGIHFFLIMEQNVSRSPSLPLYEEKIQ